MSHSINKLSFKSRKENFFTFLIFSLLSIFIFFSYMDSWPGGGADDVFNIEIAHNINKTGKAYSSTLFSMLDYLKFTIQADNIKSISNIDFSINDYSKKSSMRWHLAPIHFLIACISKKIPIIYTWSLLTSLSFTGILFISYLILRKNDISLISSMLLTFFISIHPAWSCSLSGQFFTERFYPPLCMLLILSQLQKRSIWIVSTLIILSALLSEKIVITSFIILVIHTVLYWKNYNNHERIHFISLNFLVFFYLYIVLFNYLDNDFYGLFFQTGQHGNRFINYYSMIFSKKTFIFIFFNITPLLFCIFLEPKLCILPTVLMLPNIFFSVGGYEKNGWMTHYHTSYFPILTITIIFSFISFYHKKSNNFIRKHMNVFLAIYSVILIFINPYTLTINKNGIFDYGVIRSILKTKDFFSPVGFHSNNIKIESFIQSSIPENSNVSTTETFTTFLAKTHNIFIYPFGIKNADYVVLNFEIKNNQKIYLGKFYNFDNSDVSVINRNLNQKLIEFGYEIQSPKVLNNIAILKRKNN